MTSILIEIKRGVLVVSQVNGAGSLLTASAPKEFPFAQGIDAESPFGDIPLLTEYIRHCAREAGLNGKKAVISLDDDYCIQKDFEHAKTNDANLRMLGKLEAESILHGEASTYSICVYRYGDRVNMDGEYQSGLYALPGQVVHELREGMAKQGLSLTKIVPRASAYLHAVTTAVREKSAQAYQEKCFAVLNLNPRNTRVLVFDQATPFYSHEFGTAFEDILHTIQDARSCSEEQAWNYLFEKNVFAYAEQDELCGKLLILLNMMLENIIRSVHFSAASARLDVSEVVLAGVFAQIPGLREHISQSYEVETTLLATALPHAEGRIHLSAKAGGPQLDPLVVQGTFSTPVNFLGELIEKKKRRITTASVCTTMTVLVVACMLIQPAVYYINKSMTEKAKDRLDDPMLIETRNLLSQNESLDATVKTLQGDAALFPYGLSQSAVYTEKLLELFEGTTVTSYAFNNLEGTVTVNFTVALYTDYLPINQRVTESDTFQLNVPFNATPQNDEGVAYSVGLKLKDFTLYGGTK